MFFKRIRPFLATAALGILSITGGYAGGPRNSAGMLELPISGQIYQFDKKKIEVRYLKRILIFDRAYSGLPLNLEPRPDKTIQIRFTLAEWQKFSKQLNTTPISKQTRIDLRQTLKP